MITTLQIVIYAPPSYLTSNEDNIDLGLKTIENDLEIELDIYPNPSTSSNITIDYFSSKSKIVTISVFDNLGKKEQNIIHGMKLDKGNHQFTIRKSQLSKGMKYVVIQSEGMTESRVLNIF